jgi:hypothetical protein
MAKRGRPSSASLVSFPGVTDTPPRFTPPSFLTNAEQSLFSEIVNGTDARHFVEADTPLIVSFVKATVLARDAPDLSDEEFAAWEKAARVQAMLATKLRLSPQTRLDAKTAKRHEQPPGPHTWEIPSTKMLED